MVGDNHSTFGRNFFGKRYLCRICLGLRAMGWVPKGNNWGAKLLIAGSRGDRTHGIQIVVGRPNLPAALASLG